MQPTTPIIPPLDTEAALKELSTPLDKIAPKKRSEDPRAKESYVFVINYTDANGTEYTGQFENKILSIEQRMTVSLLQARMSRNTPWEAIDSEGQYLLNVLSHLATSLVKKPDWFRTSELKDTVLLSRVFEEVASHEAFFRGQ